MIFCNAFGLSFVERFVLFRSVLYRRFHCNTFQPTKEDDLSIRDEMACYVFKGSIHTAIARPVVM